MTGGVLSPVESSVVYALRLGVLWRITALAGNVGAISIGQVLLVLTAQRRAPQLETN